MPDVDVAFVHHSRLAEDRAGTSAWRPPCVSLAANAPDAGPSGSSDRGKKLSRVVFVRSVNLACIPLRVFSISRITIRYFPDGCKAGCDEARYSDGAAAIVENRK
jgi:hypothetical protein